MRRDIYTSQPISDLMLHAQTQARRCTSCVKRYWHAERDIDPTPLPVISLKFSSPGFHFEFVLSIIIISIHKSIAWKEHQTWIEADQPKSKSRLQTQKSLSIPPMTGRMVGALCLYSGPPELLPVSYAASPQQESPFSGLSPSWRREEPPKLAIEPPISGRKPVNIYTKERRPMSQRELCLSKRDLHSC